MSDLFFQDEIDVLLDGVEGGVVEIGGDELFDFNVVIQYDFIQQDCIVCGCLLMLEMVNDCFVCYFCIGVFSVLCKICEVLVLGVCMVKFVEYVYGLVVFSNFNLVCIKLLCGIVLVVMELWLVFIVIDNFFGGDGCYYVCIEGCDFIVIENCVIQIMLVELFVVMVEVWVLVLLLEFEYFNFEINLQFVNIVSFIEMVVVLCFYVELDGGGGEIYFILLYVMVELICILFDVGVQSDCVDCDDCWSEILYEEIFDVDVEFSILLLEIEINIGDFLQLCFGDVILVQLFEFIIVFVEDVLIFCGCYGQVNGYKVV